MRLSFGFGKLDSNNHRWFKGKRGKWQGVPIRYGALLVALGRDSYYITEGRRLVGRRLWLYWKEACVHFDVKLHFDRSPYQAPDKYGPRFHPIVSPLFEDVQ